jgi:hypothetical protein
VRQALLERQNFIDLFLIFRDDDRDFGMLQHEGEFGRDRILIDWHGNPAQARAPESTCRSAILSVD